MDSGRTARHLAWLAALTLALHLPFLNQAFHMDDVNYLDIAQNVFIKPIFPLDRPYVFEGQHVTMWGHTHPPLNSYFLAALLALSGRTPSEPLLHAAYLAFPLLAVVSFYFIARRFVCAPLLASVIFLYVPAFQVMAHTLMTDAPFLSFWLAATALFLAGLDADDARLLRAALVPLCAAIFLAYQGLALVPLLALAAFLRRKLNARVAWLLALPALLLIAWQFAGFLYRGASSSSTLFGYAKTMGWGRLSTVLPNAVMTQVYLGGTILFFPFLIAGFGRSRGAPQSALGGLAIGIGFSQVGLRDYTPEQQLFFVLCFTGAFTATSCMILGAWRAARSATRDSDTLFLSLWYLGVLFYSTLMFFSASARYLLPAAPPLILLMFRALGQGPDGSPVPRRFYGALLAAQLLLGLALSNADYEFAGTYRNAAQYFRQTRLPVGGTFHFTGEWGFRYYHSALGGRILAEDSTAAPGELVVKSRLCLSRDFANAPGRSLTLVERRTYRVDSPFRLLDQRVKAGFWSDGWGVLPFWFAREPLDEISVYRVESSP